MSVLPTTIMQSVSLKPGEQFTLPPGAKLLTATDVTTLDSTCPLDDDLESIACYVFVVAVGDNDNTDTILWDAGDFKVRGWRYNGTDYDDLSVGTTGDAGALPFEIAASLADSAKNHGIYLSQVLFGYNSGDGDNGTHNFIVVKTIPSIAQKLELKVDTGASFVNGDTYTPPAYLHAAVYADVASQVTNIPPCP